MAASLQPILLLALAAWRSTAENASATSFVAAADGGAEADVVSMRVPSWCRFVPQPLLPRRCTEREGDWYAARCGHLSSLDRARTPACAYSEREAMDFAYLSSATFCDEDALEAWSCGRPCEELPRLTSIRHIHAPDMGAHALVGLLEGRCVIAFRGTSSLQAWAQNLRNTELTRLEGCSVEGVSCRVGVGWKACYQALAGDIRKRLEDIGCSKSSPLAVTGHSMGGALTSLAVFDLHRAGYNLTRSYSFGSPRIGDDIFAKAFNEISFEELPYFRVARADDPYVYLPRSTSFRHVGTEVYYPGNTPRGHRVCDATGEDPACQGRTGDANVAGLLLQCVVPHVCGHMRYFQPEMRGIMGRWACRPLQKTVLP